MNWPALQEKLPKEAATGQRVRGKAQLGGCNDMTSRATGFAGLLRAAVLAVAAGGAALPAVAQESTNRVATKTDWAIFAEDNPKECWGVSAPKESELTKDGKPVQARRDPPRLFVTFRPGQGKPEVSFTGGYKFAPGSAVSLQVGDQTFAMIVDGEWAWAENPAGDSSIVDALKNGESAILTGKSARGTQTKDNFSLLGFTAAMEEAESRCK